MPRAKLGRFVIVSCAVSRLCKSLSQVRPTLYHLGHEDNCGVGPKNWVYITNRKWGESLTPLSPYPGGGISKIFLVQPI